jgi:hypothetical protein
VAGGKNPFKARFIPPRRRFMRLTVLDNGKPGVLPGLKFSAKRGHGRGVPGGLRRGRKFGVFPPRWADTAAGSSVCAEKYGEKGMVGGIKHAAAHTKRP